MDRLGGRAVRTHLGGDCQPGDGLYGIGDLQQEFTVGVDGADDCPESASIPLGDLLDPEVIPCNQGR